MEYRKLGGSDLEVSVLSFGAWQLGDPDYWGPDAQADTEEAVKVALDAGVNLFDTAESYGAGEAERALGKALGKQRGDVLVASKVNPENCAPEKLRAACEASLERLGMDHIDLYQIHWPSREAAFEDTIAELIRLKEEGKIRLFGVSNFGPMNLDTWLESGEIVSNQLGYNIVFRATEYKIMPACRRHGLGVLAYMPLMQGLLTGRWRAIEEIPLLRRRTRHYASSREGTRHGEPGHEDLLMETVRQLERFAEAIGVAMATMCLCWVMAQPGVSSVLLGARNPKQVGRNLEAAALDLGPAAIAQLNEISGPLKTRMGDNADLWLAGADSRIR